MPIIDRRRITVRGTQYDVELTVDIVGLMDSLGYKAAANRTGKAHIGAGLVKARAYKAPRVVNGEKLK